MRGISGQEEVPVPPSFRHHRVEAVDGRAHQVPLVGAQPRPHQLPDLLGRLHVPCGLTGLELELPPPPAGVAGHEGAGSSRVADLLGRPAERVDRSVDLDVDHQPLLVEPQVDHADPVGLAGGAVGPVAGEGPPGADLVAAGGSHDHATVVVGGGDRRDLAPEPEVGAPVDRLGPEHHVELRLVVEAHRWIAVGGDEARRQVEAGEPVAVGVDELGARQGGHQRVERLPQSPDLEHAADLVVHPHRPGERVQVGLPLEHGHVQTVVTRRDRRGRAHRAAPDHDHVGRGRGHPGPVSRRAACEGASSAPRAPCVRPG